MDYSFNEDIVQHQLVFSEINDSDTKRSKVKIGYISHDPREYIARKDLPVLNIDSDGTCRTSNIETKFDFVPELQWFAMQAFHAPEIVKFLQENPHLVGPTGLVKMIADHGKDAKYEFSHEITHRNIPCDVYRRQYSRPGCDHVSVELYIPKSQIADPKGRRTYFTVKETANNIVDAQGNKISMSYTIDYFYFDDIDNDVAKKEKMEDDFSLSMGRGCSYFLPQIHPKLNSQSMVMSYVRKSSLEPHMIAYDQAGGYLRRESPGQRVTIWDINEGLMYNTDPSSVFGTLNAKIERDSLCSVMNVADKNLHSNYRPFEAVGQPLSILQLIGADSVAYIGRDVVREIPCIVFEAAFRYPPIIFGLTSSEELVRPKSSETRFIVQYYIMHPDRNDAKQIEQHFSSMSDKEFWPARISLYEVDPTAGTKLIETLDIYDFYLSLHGWPMKASQMFMAPACFTDEKEITTIEMTMIFDKAREQLINAEYFRILAHNKYKLEYDLLRSLFSDVFRMSRLHLVSFDLNLRPHHVSVDMIVGNQRDQKVLTYFGEGQAPWQGRNTIVLDDQTEDSCVSAGSLIRDVNLVVWCPPVDTSKETSCIISFGSNEPTIEKYSKPTEAPCQAYRLLDAIQTNPTTHDWTDRKRELIDWSFEFKAVDYYREVAFTGTVHDVDLKQALNLIYLPNKRFKPPKESSGENNEPTEEHNGEVKLFSEISYRSIADCAKMCSLDADCRSYSYCQEKSDCLITSLDLRLSEVESQLMHMNPVILDFTTHKKYELVDDQSCAVFERDYLDAFSQTEEQVQMDRRVATQMPITDSPNSCAKQAIDLETAVKDHHAALFVYCPTTSTCILDEELFRSVGSDGQANSNGTRDSDDDAGEMEQEERCIMYRKKYQNYFHVSPKVYALSKKDQMELSFDTVEECARACWNQFGRVCASFDYCSPKTCLINRHSETGKKTELELRNECLHYERDLKLDELRKKHMIGRHEVLEGALDVPQMQPATFARVVLNLVLLTLVVGSFVLGLLIGGRTNDRILMLLNQHPPTTSGASSSCDNISPGRRFSTGKRLSRALINWQGFARRFGGSMQWSQPIMDSENEASTDPNGVQRNETIAEDAELYGSSNAIQLDVIKGATNEAYQEKD